MIDTPRRFAPPHRLLMGSQLFWILAVASSLIAPWTQEAPAAPAAKLVAAASANGEDSEISADGRFVAFDSVASNLVAGDTNGGRDVFVRDRVAGTTERVSVASGGAQASGESFMGSISADGRFVAFDSEATNLVAGDTNRSRDVFVHDRIAGTTERVNIGRDDAQANDESLMASISADGRFVVFESDATNLVADDTNRLVDVLVRDRLAENTERVSVASGGAQANDSSTWPSISADGRFVVFDSYATNLVAGDTNRSGDVFVHDRVAGTTERVSVANGGAQANRISSAGSSTFVRGISADGRFVAFESDATNLAAGDTNGSEDVFVRDRVAGTTERVNIGRNGVQANDDSSVGGVSADGRFVAFESDATNLVAADTNRREDVFVRDRAAGATERVSVASGGAEANEGSGWPSISADGRFVGFDSDATNLVVGDKNGRGDVFVRDRVAGTTTLVSVVRKFTVRAGALVLRPWPARPGKRLNTTMAVSASGAPVASARVRCAATLAGRKLPVSARSFRGGTARCVWQIPADARGKQLKGSLAAITAEGTARRYFVGIVR